MEADIKEVLGMTLSPFTQGANDEPMRFCLVRYKRQGEGKKLNEWDIDDALVAA